MQSSKTTANHTPDRQARQSGSNPRDVAGRVLERVLDQHLFLDAAEATEGARLAALSPSDRALSRRLILAALRRTPEIDGLIDARLDHALPDEAAAARHALRIVATETVLLGGPAHAAVGAAVAAIKRRAPRFAGLVNAVGRKIAALGPTAALPEAAAARANAPDWLIAALESDWGAGAAQACLTAHLAPPPLDLTVRDPQTAPAIAQALDGVLTPTGSVRIDPRGAITQTPGFDEGLWWVQDAAAALPTLLLAPQPGETILDLCAAPGGKTLQLAAAGARVTALDVSAARAARLRENLSRTGLSAQIVIADAADATAARGPTDRAKDDRASAEIGAGFDAVLLDAPCTGTGTIRRHPDLPRIKDLSELDRLTAQQDALLDAAWARVRPGGRLVFCTCSLLRAEGETRVEAALARWPDAALEPPGPATAERLGAFLDGAALRSLPGHWPRAGGLDGFFAARLGKAG